MDAAWVITGSWKFADITVRVIKTDYKHRCEVLEG
jgi:hypothetical protein